MKVLFTTNIPSPYRVNFFNELGKHCDLTVLLERNASSERDSSWKKYATEHFKAVVLKGVKMGVDHAFCLSVVRHLKKGLYDRIVISNFTSPTGMLAILWLRMKKIPYWLESDGGFPKGGAGIKEKIKKFFIRGAEGYFSTADMHDRYYLQYGANPERIHRYPFTSLYARDILETPVNAEQKQALRQELSITEPRVLLSVGQFIHRKGYDVLLNAMAKLPEDIGCYIVGGEPTESYIQQVAALGLTHVHFVGFCQKPRLEKYYKASDVFVFPTREDIWGLVVNEAMGYGLPVITTDKCIAGLELVGDDENGYIVPVGDAAALTHRLNRIFADPAGMERMAEVSLEKIAPYTIENMARIHLDALRKNLKG